MITQFGLPSNGHLREWVIEWVRGEGEGGGKRKGIRLKNPIWYYFNTKNIIL